MQLKLERRRCWTADGDDENIYDDPGAGVYAAAGTYVGGDEG